MRGMFGKEGKGTFGSVGCQGKHGFCAEDATDTETIEAAAELIPFVGFDTVSKAKAMEGREGVADAGRNPGAVLIFARHVCAVSDDIIECAIDAYFKRTMF